MSKLILKTEANFQSWRMFWDQTRFVLFYCGIKATSWFISESVLIISCCHCHKFDWSGIFGKQTCLLCIFRQCRSWKLFTKEKRNTSTPRPNKRTFLKLASSGASHSNRDVAERSANKMYIEKAHGVDFLPEYIFEEIFFSISILQKLSLIPVFCFVLFFHFSVLIQSWSQVNHFSQLAATFSHGIS